MVRRFATIAVLAIVPVGCMNWPKWMAPGPTAAKPRHVDWESGESGKQVVSPEAFGERVTTLLDAERVFSATAYVELYPEIAAAVLLAPPTVLPPDVLAFIERVHDIQCASESGPRWDARRKAAAPLAAVYRLSEASVKETEHALQLCRATEGTPAALEGCQIAARIYLGSDRAADAATTLKNGLAAATGRPYEAIGLWLLYAESARRSGQAEQGDLAWAKAVGLAVALLDRPHGARDPQLWERLASQRPVQSAWPVEVGPALTRAARAAGIPLADGGPADGLVWTVVGCWRLDRNEPQAALAAFKRAATLTTDQTNRSLLQVWQAKALIPLDQAPAATALVVPLTDHPSPAVAGPALIVQGAIQLQAGAFGEARTFFERAQSLPGNWPGKLSGTTNLALTLLLAGDDQDGLAYLHAAEANLRDAGDWSALLLALRNEADYWKTKGNQKELQRVESQILRIEQTGSDL